MPFLVMGTIDEAGDFLPVTSIAQQAWDDQTAKSHFTGLCLGVLRKQFRTVTGKSPHMVPLTEIFTRLPYYVGVILENVEPVVEAFYLQQALEQQDGSLLQLWITGER